MSSTPPQSAKYPAVQPATPDTPYHSVRETGTDVSESDGEEYFSDATEGHDRVDFQGFDREVNDYDDEDDFDAQTPSVRERHPSFPNTMPSDSNPLIPTLVVDKTEDDHPVHGTVPGTLAYEKRKGDATPDETYEHQDSHTTSGVPRKSLDTDIPTVVLEKTPDDYQAYGSIPGTPAYGKRMADSIPDEIHVRDADLPESSPARSRSASTVRREQAAVAEIPKLVLEKVDNEPSYGEVPGTQAFNKRKADASPDAIITSPIASPSISRSASPTFPSAAPTSDPQTQYAQESLLKDSGIPGTASSAGDGDDFDDFGEAQEGGTDDDFGDFGDFDDGNAAVPEVPEVPATKSQAPSTISSDRRSFVPDFTKMNSAEIESQVTVMLSSMFSVKPSESDVKLPPPGDSMFLTERSLSLWNQLSAPPPLQPPNWKLSRIRRLFLVSLGVPVDLDEILPAETKQKKLVLPSANTVSRKSTDASRGGGGDNSGVSRSTSRRRKKGEPESVTLVDVPAARILCSTSDIKLKGFTEGELRDHVKRLEEVTKEASETLTYWLGRREVAMGDKETFESVIENLVVFARKGR